MKNLLTGLFFFTSAHSFAQQSIFHKDTVSFTFSQYFHSDENQSESAIEQFGSNNSLVQKVYVDHDKNVHWQLLKRRYDIFIPLESSFIREEKVLDSLPDNYTFKARIEKEAIVYRDVNNPKKVLFYAPLTAKKKVGKLPFFINEAYIGILQDTDEDYVFTSDTFIVINEEKIPCYLFTSVAFDQYESQATFEFTYSELYIEKSSLLPIYRTLKMSGRFRYRTDWGHGSANDRNLSNSRYSLEYLLRRIEPIR